MTTHNPYNRIARVYEPLESIYSGGAIRRSKRAHLLHVNAGGKVLYAGVGAGEDARDGAGLGAEVTAVDQSPEMLRRAERRLAQTGRGKWRVVLGNIMDYRGPAFDLVVAHFFLNLFDMGQLPRIINGLTDLVRPGGKLQIADFSPFETGISGLAQRVYWYVPLTISALLTHHPIHPIYDYSCLVEETGMKIMGKRTFPIFGVGPRWFYCLTAQKPEAGESF